MNKTQVKTKEDLELYYSKVRKIRFAEDDLKFNSLEELFKRYVNKEKNTTVFKKGTLHCGNGRFRSVDDFLIIAKNYFPNLTVKQILSEFKTFLGNPINDNSDYSTFTYVGYCCNIRKNNLFYSHYKPTWTRDNFKNVQLNRNGFKNCSLTIKNLLE